MKPRNEGCPRVRATRRDLVRLNFVGKRSCKSGCAEGYPVLRSSPWRFRLLSRVELLPSSTKQAPSEGVSKEDGIVDAESR